MNYFENEIAKYQRRVDRIAGKPSANMLSSNRLLYQAKLNDCQEQLQWWQQGKPFIGVGGSGMTTLMRCFGDFQIINIGRIADQLGIERAEACVDKLRSLGLPDYTCDRAILFLPLMFMGDDLPKPSLIVSRTGACEVINDTHRTLAKLLGVPMFTLDIPFEDPHPEHLPYVTAQIEKLISFVEANVPGAKFDFDKLLESQRFGQRWFAALHDIYELRRRVPCPDHPRDVFREPMAPGQYADPSLIVEYYERYRDELTDRAARGWSPVGEEKLRIVWAITGPYGSNIWDYLAERGVSVPYWHYGAAATEFYKPIHGGADFAGKLTPLQREAWAQLYNSWGGTGERWTHDTIHAGKEFQANGIVLFEQTGCQPMVGIGELVKRRIEQELDIPVWRVEGRQLLGRSERVESEFMSGLEAFINLCFERKKS